MKVKSVDPSESESEACFRVSVCLRRFFSDERARVLVWADARRPVRWLRRRLRRLLGAALPRRAWLLCRGHLLPPDEPLALLRPDDAVEVIPVPPTCDWACNEGFFQKPLESTENEHEDDLNKTNCNQEADSNKSDNTENELLDVDIADCTLEAEAAEPESEGDTTDGKYFVPQVPFEHKKIQEELNQVKENALALLESYSIQSAIEIPFARGTKRTRRRCRRRKMRTSVTCEVNGEALLDQCDFISEKTQSPTFYSNQIPQIYPSTEAPFSDTSVPVSSVQPQSPVSLTDSNAVSIVLRNGAATPRAARVVHPLTVPTDNKLAVH